MADLDVSFLLDDPDFVDPIVVKRRVESVDDFGVGSYTQQTFQNVAASVQAGGGSIIRQFPEATNVGSSVLVYSRFHFVNETDTTQPDIITWQGRDFRVTGVKDWGNYGSGFYVAVAEMVQLVEASP